MRNDPNMVIRLLTLSSLAMARILALPILTYRLFISPWWPGQCRFDPSCSQYALEALRLHGVVGLWYVIRRLARCHPWGGSGFDPVPARTNHSCLHSHQP